MDANPHVNGHTQPQPAEAAAPIRPCARDKAYALSPELPRPVLSHEGLSPEMLYMYRTAVMAYAAQHALKLTPPNTEGMWFNPGSRALTSTNAAPCFQAVAMGRGGTTMTMLTSAGFINLGYAAELDSRRMGFVRDFLGLAMISRELTPSSAKQAGYDDSIMLASLGVDGKINPGLGEGLDRIYRRGENGRCVSPMDTDKFSVRKGFKDAQVMVQRDWHMIAAPLDMAIAHWNKMNAPLVQPQAAAVAHELGGDARV